CNQYFSGYTF
nr:immunoglobulin light chain junction region [Macaca mulatta]